MWRARDHRARRYIRGDHHDRAAGFGFLCNGSCCNGFGDPCRPVLRSDRRHAGAHRSKLQAKAAAGPTAKEGVAAGMGVQPTPASIAAAEEKLGEISPKKLKAIKRGMARARVADKVGDLRACRKALAAVQRVLGP
jgi:hypothetical protein